MRRFYFALFVLVLVLLGTQTLTAATHYVGSCKTGAYATIQAAVSAVPSGSTVQVCPGTYYEQVVISQPLTLEAIPNSNGSALISDAGVSLATTTSLSWGTVAPQVWVTAGPVNITNIAVSQTTAPPPTEVGIFYASGSSGAVKGTAVYGTANYVGIVAENGAGATQSVTIENNYLSGQMSGISVYSDQTPPSLTVVVKNNSLSIAGGGIGIESLNYVQGSISNNFIAFTVPGEGWGMMAGSPNVRVSGNWIWNPGFIGIDIPATASVTSNQILGGGTGIKIDIDGVTVKNNGITGDSVAIEFNCTTGNTVTSNIIKAANVGLDKVPAGFTGVNTFYNVGKRTTDGCGS